LRKRIRKRKRKGWRRALRIAALLFYDIYMYGRRGSDLEYCYEDLNRNVKVRVGFCSVEIHM